MTTNRKAGLAFEKELTSWFEKTGATVDRGVTKRTPFGKRVIDLEISRNGKVLGGIEAKVGRSPYKPSQRAKDWWLGRNGYPVAVVRKPR